MQKIQGNIVNIFDNSIFFGEVTVTKGRIFGIQKFGEPIENYEYILPGFIDAHVHIESSMLVPAEFAKLAVVHGTVATVSDPHEIANVLGIEGVNFMIQNGKEVPFKFCFGAPSCVPATRFESSGAILSDKDIAILMASDDIGYLAEMMNYPGAINGDLEILNKLASAVKYNKPIDGHAPGLRRMDAEAYFNRGITTDHECFTLEEAKEKLDLGVKVIIREGSAAKNFNALIPLAHEHSEQLMLCSDDKHPDDLVLGHINLLVKRALDFGIDLFKVLKMASLNPVRHYNLPVGLLREGESADFIIVNNLKDFSVLKTFINGECVAEAGKSNIKPNKPILINNFKATKISIEDIKFDFSEESRKLNVIKVNDGQLVTDKVKYELPINKTAINDYLGEKDILKLVVYNRYKEVKPSVAFINGFGLTSGAIASSVAHDSHNIIAVGTDDDSIMEAINLIVREKGGISAVSDSQMGVLALPIAGLMSEDDGFKVANDYTQIDLFAKNQLGSKLKSPFMSLSFMALLVIPTLKLSDKGLFDGGKFEFIDLVE
jgi:adenine deaminase